MLAAQAMCDAGVERRVLTSDTNSRWKRSVRPLSMPLYTLQEMTRPDTHTVLARKLQPECTFPTPSTEAKSEYSINDDVEPTNPLAFVASSLLIPAKKNRLGTVPEYEARCS